MNKIIKLIVAMAALTICFSCNDEWKDEQFAHYVGFKAPINSDGCTTVYVKYNESGETVHYQLPLIVSGSTVHSGDINAVVEIDADTLEMLNLKNIGEHRPDIWYHNLADAEDEANDNGEERVLTTFPATVRIPSGVSVATLDLELNLTNLNQEERWILPLRVAENQPGYQANTRKHYNNALLHVVPFNDFSGAYSANSVMGFAQKTSANGQPIDGQYDSRNPYVVPNKQFYATGENTAFFYAGAIDHTHKDRKRYRVNITFLDHEKVALEASETAQKGGLNFSYEPDASSYTVSEVMDDVQTYLLRKTVIVNLKYYMTDYSQGVPVNYKYEGAYTLLRIINTQIPDQDQAIQW